MEPTSALVAAVNPILLEAIRLSHLFGGLARIGDHSEGSDSTFLVTVAHLAGWAVAIELFAPPGLGLATFLSDVGSADIDG